MKQSTTSLEVRRQGKKLKLYAMGKTARGTKIVVNVVDLAEDPVTHRMDKSKVASEIVEVLGQTPA